MANKNNCYFNAALSGFVQGVMSGRFITDATAADYVGVKNAAVAFATEVDGLIAFDALVTTANNDPTMLLADASHTVQSDTGLRPALLHGICAAAVSERFQQSAVAGDYADVAAACAALFTETVAGLVSP